MKRPLVVLLLVVVVVLAASLAGGTAASARVGEGSLAYFISPEGTAEGLPLPPNTARAANGDTVTLIGEGTFRLDGSEVTGGGTYVNKDAAGHIITKLAFGTWEARRLLSYQTYGPATSLIPPLPKGSEGGVATIEVHLSAMIRNLEFDAILTIDCIFGNEPSGAKEGIKLDVIGFQNFDEVVTGATLFVGPTDAPSATPPAPCGARPASCLGAAKAALSINEGKAGKEKFRAVLKKFDTATTQASFGDPVTGTTKHTICVYDEARSLVSTMVVDRAGATCGTKPCWKAISKAGYEYNDRTISADGIQKITDTSGAVGKGSVEISGKKGIPAGVSRALNGNQKVTVQVLADDGACIGATLTNVRKAEGAVFRATLP